MRINLEPREDVDNMVTEIRSFHSLKEFSDSIEKEVSFYEASVDEYSQRLGSFLREVEVAHGNEEWFKKLSALQKSSKEKKSKGKKKKGGASGWVEFKELTLSTEDQGEAQILFEATDEIKRKLTRLTKILDIVEDLKGLGLGEDILYLAYVRDDVPERIVLRRKGEKGAAEKFEFATAFSLSKIRGF